MCTLAATLGQALHSQSKSSFLRTFETRRVQLVNNQNLDYFTDVNFYARYTHGNRRKGGLKIMHWNAGGGFLKNKIHDIENVISGYRPHLFGVSETRFKKGHDIADVQIQDYEVYFSKTLDNPDLEVPESPDSIM